jgi:hypothetical protein
MLTNIRPFLIIIIIIIIIIKTQTNISCIISGPFKILTENLNAISIYIEDSFNQEFLIG